MNVIRVDPEDGRGEIEVVVRDHADAERLLRLCRNMAATIRDEERWRNIAKYSTHYAPRSGMWELHFIGAGCSIEDAVDRDIEQRRAR